MVLDDLAEFSAKPELEIYADDVKCSHGSTSGSIDDGGNSLLDDKGDQKKLQKTFNKWFSQ